MPTSLPEDLPVPLNRPETPVLKRPPLVPTDDQALRRSIAQMALTGFATEMTVFYSATQREQKEAVRATAIKQAVETAFELADAFLTYERIGRVKQALPPPSVPRPVLRRAEDWPENE